MGQPIIIGSILVYAAILFVIAYWADQQDEARTHNNGALIYGLSLAVYCTSWTFYGAVGTAETRGWEYLPIYLGPFLVFSIGRPLVWRMLETGKSMHTTSIADFISAHYGKSRRLAALVTLIAVIGALPYIALQLKSVATTFDYLSASAETSISSAGSNSVFLVAVVLALFAVLFGTRHIDITKHNRGMITAIAFESIFKLIALFAVGLFAVMLSTGEVGQPELPVFSAPVAIDRFVTLTLISMSAILCLPRQFHVTVVECQNSRWVGGGSNLFLIYLVFISLLVVPIAQAGSSSASLAGVPADLTVLALPLSQGADALALFVFVGGFAAATGMVIVACVALSTMITNDLVAPFLLGRSGRRGSQVELGSRLLMTRRASIIGMLLIAAIFAVYAPSGEQLASLGILSFAAVAQFAPALIGALYWRGARPEGALAGMAAGFAIWALVLFAPSYFGADASPMFIQPTWLDFTGWDILTRGVAVSLGVNTLLFWGVSTVWARSTSTHASKTDKPVNQEGAIPRIRAGDFYLLIQRCLGEAEATSSINAFESARARLPDADRFADADLVAFADQQISKAIGASSASILLKSVLAGGALRLDDVATLLGETTGKVSFSQELLQTTLENISHGVSVVDADLNLVAWNAAYVEMYQYPPEFVRAGQPIADLIRYNAEQGECGPGAIDDHVDRRLARLREGQRHSIERTRPDGRVVRIEGMRSPSGAYVTTFTDVTEYKRIEKALINSERSIRFYTDNIPSMVAFSDTNEVIRFANSAYRTTFSVDESVVGKAALNTVMSPADYAARKPYIDAALRGEKTSFDIDIETEEGLQHHQVTYVPQFRATGDVRGFFGLYQDVTARRRAEAALAETNETLEERVAQRTRELSELNAALDVARHEAELATASKTRFLAAASHDVLQPLNAARLFVSALRETDSNNDEIIALTEKTDASIASADRLLRSLLNISKLDAGGVQPEFTEFSVQNIFDEFSNDFAISAANKGLEYRTAPTSLWVKSDRGLLFSALQNIISNAVRYTDRGRILVGAHRRGDTVRIDIIDTGRGIPEARQTEIFQEFKSLERDRDAGGAGLGLAMVDRIVKTLGLGLTLKSTEGVGTHFSIIAPLAAPKTVVAAKPVTPSASASLQNLNIICIDNDKSVREGMEALLSRWGCKAQCFSSIEETLAAIDAKEPPDLLLLDYQLDDDQTGFDALDALKTVWRKQPLTIMITASASDAVIDEAARAAIPVLAKPIEPAELRALINQLLRQAAE